MERASHCAQKLLGGKQSAFLTLYGAPQWCNPAAAIIHTNRCTREPCLKGVRIDCCHWRRETQETFTARLELHRSKKTPKTNIRSKFHGTVRFTIIGTSISVSTLLNCVIFDTRPSFEPHWFLRFSSRCLLSPVHQRQHTSAPPESNSHFSYSIPFSGWSSVSIVQDHVHPFPKHTHAHTNNGGHSTDCLLYSPERLATWLLLTFNRVHYGGRAPIQLLHNTGDILLVFLAPLWAFPCSFHPKLFTLCPPVIPPKVAVLFYKHSTTCLVSLHLPQGLWVTSQ